MTKDEALKLSLEALQNPWKAGPDGVADAIIAIKEALAQPEPVKIAHKHEWFRTGEMKVGQMRCISCGTWGQEETPQLEQKPVAWVGIDLDNMAEAFHRVIEEHHSRKNPFHDPVNGDAMIALRELLGLIAYMKRNITPPPCPTCEALARTVMMDQTGRDA